MPIAEIRLQPGLDVEQTPTFNAAGYNEMDFGRFRAGLFQKLGGWTRFFPFAMNGDGRALHSWQDLNSNKRLAVATTREVDAITNGVLQNITPQVLLTNPNENFSTISGDATVTIVDPGITNVTPDDTVEFLTPVSVGGLILSGVYPIATRVSAHAYTIEARALATATVNNVGAVPSFTTVADSATVTVTLANHAQVAGNIVVFPVATSVGGIIVSGKYNVLESTGANTFTIAVPASAVSADTQSMNGGNVAFRYWLAIGPSGAGLGYGLGGYGLGGYGLGGGSGTDQTGDALQATNWSLDNWGELLLGCPENLGLYFWAPNGGFLNMQLVTQAPAYNKGMIVSQALQQVITYGGSLNAWDPVNQVSGVPGIGIFQDPLLIQWCDQSNFFEWEARADTQAGNFRIPSGSEIIGASSSKNRNLFWTDLELWAGIYTGQPFIYSHNKVGEKCGLIGKHAWTSYGDTTYWMGQSNFFAYAGSGVQTIPCTVWDEVFQDLDPAFQHLCVAGSNTDFTEIWFFYPSKNARFGYPNKVAKFNITENTWDTDNIPRFAWLDRSILGNPIAISNTGLLYKHEDGYDNDNAPLTPRMLSGYFAVAEGEDAVTIDRFIPDFKYGTFGGSSDAQITLKLFTVDNPNDDPAINGPYTFTKATSFVVLDPPVRARLIAVEISSSDQASFWRLGLLKFRYAPAGRIMGAVVG